MPRGPSEEVERRILALARDAPRQTRLPARVGRGLAVGLVVTALSVAVHPRADLSRLSPVDFTICTGGLVLVTALAFVLSLRSRSSTGPRVGWLMAVVAATTPLFAAVTLFWALGPAPSVSPWTSIKGGLGCLATMMVVGAIGLAGLASAFRHAVPVAPRLRGAAFGAAAGALAGVAMHLRCPSLDPLHIALGHVGPIALVTALGALVGPRVLRP